MAGRPVRNNQRSPKSPAKVQNPEKLKDPKYALALHIVRQRRAQRGKGMPPGMPPAPMR